MGMEQKLSKNFKVEKFTDFASNRIKSEEPHDMSISTLEPLNEENFDNKTKLEHSFSETNNPLSKEMNYIANEESFEEFDDNQNLNKSLDTDYSTKNLKYQDYTKNENRKLHDSS